MLLGFKGAEGSAAYQNYLAGWVPVIAVVAVLSMLLGNLVAIVQSSVKRLLAYSAIAHAGYMLLAVLAHDQQVAPSLIYYAVTYGLTTIGAFAVVAVVEAHAGDDKLSSFTGLSCRAPVVALCMMIFMLSLAGIPPLAGFFGKFYLFAAVLKSGGGSLGLLWLVIFAVGMSAVSFYYYLKVLKQIYVVKGTHRADATNVSVLTQVVLGLMASGVLLLGLLPNLLVEKLVAAMASGGH
jgi:NADH-quinone oxidoreductase subunit N